MTGNIPYQRRENVPCHLPGLYQWMVEHQITQKQLSRMIGVTEATLSNWMTGKAEPKLYYTKKILKVTKRSIWDVLKTEEDDQ